MTPRTARLLITCPDGKGIIAAVAGFLAKHGGNILDADQHTDPGCGEFFMRVVIELDGFELDSTCFPQAFSTLAKRYQMRWHVHWGDEVKRMAIMASRESHCVSDLLWRWQSGELRVELPLILGNHPDLSERARQSGIPFHHLPVTPETRPEQERQVRELLRDAKVDLIVLARYMQVLSPDFVAEYPERIINIHHSFLPAFAGPRPYRQAHDRGVKIIGATSHYVTQRLDEGPIIAQATLPIDHRDTVDDLVRKGRDLERVVLASAVRLHVQDKILVSKNKTIVFD